ncbi:P-loop NTPase fold protein [Idiomarina sp. HP20-50]|uniref:KAP family P-loop NTPase fold protein n=1 Tax=Idiomarina sp. HP20-50 TaxID=3070813 RepID=UPI00294B3153|nr:P-loop NTPase fold protein [Idiomarina sp. HP20-50]MDV6314797.1 P-loop NTPase fold protein [Idiomarina sp. HP20-50]
MSDIDEPKPALTFENRDEFRREPIASQLISLLTSDIDISPLVIDGDWGTGKTEFCQKLIHKLKSEDSHKVLYIDAFKADHADNPLMTILSGVLSLIEDGEKQSNLREKAIPVLRLGTKVLGKAILSHVLKANADSLGDELASELDSATDEAIDATVRNLLKDHEEAEANIKALQDTLASIAHDTPIVIFIDELDRCRPDFSVQVLELIKHTFDIPGVDFVLVTNTTQLKAAINHAYGAGVEASRYLDKFIKFKCSLPQKFIPEGGSHYHEKAASVEHLSRLLYDSQVLKNTKLIEHGHIVKSVCEELTILKNLSLREVETFVRHIEIYHQLTQKLESNQYPGYCLLRLFGIFIFCFEQKLEKSIINNSIDIEYVAKYLGLLPGSEWAQSNAPRKAIELIAYFLIQELEGDEGLYSAPEGQASSYVQMEQRLFGSFGLRDNQAFETIKSSIQNFYLGASS